MITSAKDTLPNGSSPSSQTNNENCSDAWVQLTNDPVLWIDRIAAIFRQLQPWQSQPAKSTSPNNSNYDIFENYSFIFSLYVVLFSSSYFSYFFDFILLKNLCAAVEDQLFSQLVIFQT